MAVADYRGPTPGTAEPVADTPKSRPGDRARSNLSGPPRVSGRDRGHFENDRLHGGVALKLKVRYLMYWDT